MKYKLNRQERKDILKEVEKCYGDNIVGTESESNLDQLILLAHKLYNNIYYREKEDLINVINNTDETLMKKVLVKALDKIHNLKSI